MIHVERVRQFKNHLYFFNWLHKTVNKCGVCGVPDNLVAGVFNSPADPVWDGTGKVIGYRGDNVWFCENCWNDLVG
jgi:hypothetical protein